jgi:predicted 2-oxoglutarate/Fe(II)-dependent dioxygenase YbiX/peroxiredoxin
MDRLAPGDFVPDFRAESTINPAYHFDTLGGHRVLLLFVVSGATEPGRWMCEALQSSREWLRQQGVLPFVVTADPRDRDGRLAEIAQLATIFWDCDRAVHKLYGMTVDQPGAAAPPAYRAGGFLIRENLRLHAYLSAAPIQQFVESLTDAVATLPPRTPAEPVGGHAPVLQVPDVLDRSFCRRLIDFYEAKGGKVSGFMRDVGGTTRGLLDASTKRRFDCYIDDSVLQQQIRTALQRRVLPEIQKAFWVRMTRVERYLIGCYDETDQGFFRAHRDNVSKGTAHRQFAVSLNLNSEEYEGGALRFPEYGRRLYKPETGSAVVFSCALLHEAMPVTTGRRFVLLPFLYDERHAVLRAQNKQYLDTGPLTPVEHLGHDQGRTAAR